MRRPAATALCLALLPVACDGGENRSLESEEEKLGYSIGYQVGADFRRQRIELQTEPVVQGVIDAVEGNEPALTPAEMRGALADVRRLAAEAEARRQGEESGEPIQ